MTLYPLLDTISDPAQVRKLDRRQLPQLADELRAFLVDSVSRTGGHLSSNLGTVELTVALHYVFDTPHDRLVWDVGHQTYAHKALTGRREGMARLRMHGGISGFPKRSESRYDTFGVGHSSTSISAALGMALAAKIRHETRKVVAIIGDGAMSAGQAFEALNNAGVADADMLVVLNDNDMSISPPVGALNRYLARLFSGNTFNAARKAGEKILDFSPSLLEFAKRAEEHVKGMLTPGTLFEELGLNYIGPIDGHDLESLVPTLLNLKNLKGPQFLHVITKKGQGYKLAEVDPILYHGVSKFKPEVGIAGGKPGAKPSYTQVFGDWLCDMAAADPRLVGITPAMREGSGLLRFSECYPDRYYDVGIAEQHAVTFAAGLACEGMRPVLAIYSTFLQRGYDQLVHDVALQNLPVVFALDRGGLVGADGPTHHGAFDVSFLTCIPNMVLMTPSDEDECRKMLTTAYRLDGPSAVRYPRGTGTGATIDKALVGLPLGKGEIRRRGSQVALLAFGSMLTPALEAGEELDATVANMRFVKPIDRELIIALAAEHSLLVSVEENSLIGGAGSEVARVLEDVAGTTRLLRLGIPDRFIEHGDQALLLAEIGLDRDGIVAAVRARQDSGAGAAEEIVAGSI
ncbi:MAG: 1-deoxy-D-xylulose-5-phosphate synthase [Candidatus Accumulibacter regalis]|jgi:1-deoxy-D-xylulose-5-phosphate synthase (EC 2.2.1.7)|uniref:1-deoxy-D-xylulose-5-phosphate synthase n=1 Tax=Accumulibacter regalis TaxID=522306 RepID=A0A011QM61_ACCRE|nr:1-deoxy-D-xylulose-5-phosphate synthase [Accumulibacter sp.]EXI90412.1 MAG: 1-deoxy-D-xylulose-5-phosphate synthase [Candidatus Accumulibacter regalis]MBL8369069.1 1-deoxy-D-xylulose-5-phosphate synthase [Accumulibacter sp.]MBN8515590.1 1-deoxy-D-xylulose-5-phosphate synthase [Accumulibacter sp.]MBO3704113.1 1-deoxy-D-xylulose-5-phosphate synthase [Accumulibacter sp.]HRE70771.1 1-deoxy-D-xylulose-5-phosphate synthase [Accumulibacter sp.]